MKKLKSYESYVKQYSYWANKGYGMDPLQSREQFEKTYQMAKKAGIKNITREIAKAERSYTRDAAKKLLDRINSDDRLKELRQYFKTTKDIMGIERRGELFEFFYILGYSGDEFEAIY